MRCPNCGTEETTAGCPKCGMLVVHPASSGISAPAFLGFCQDCKHWKPGEGWDCPTTHGYCNRFKKDWEVPLDEVIKPPSGPGGHGEPGTPPILRTGPLFGCIKFELKGT